MLAELAGLAVVALVLGVRHGLDADHLATIDGLTRSYAHRCWRRANSCGLLFSAGHGVAIVMTATVLAAMGQHVASPTWLRELGSCIAIGTLMTLGSINLWSAWRAPSGKSHHPISIKRWLAGRFIGRPGPLGIMGVGSLFAVSFDAVGIAVLFAASAITFDKAWVAAALGAAFSLGMSTVGGLAGWGSAWMLRRSNALVLQAPRVSGSLLGIGCLATATALLAEPTLTRSAGFNESQALTFSACVGLLVPLTYAATWLFRLYRGRRSPAFSEEQKR